MAERDDRSIAPRRSLGGPIIPPPPPEMAADARKAEERKATRSTGQQPRQPQASQQGGRPASAPAPTAGAATGTSGKAARSPKPEKQRRPARAPRPAAGEGGKPASSPRRTRRAQLRLVQVDAWSVMKTSFLLSIALGIVLVVAVAIIWSVLGAAGVWDSINSVVQQAVGGEGEPFDIREYLATSRILGFTMIVAVLDVILITAIATLGAFLYNLSAALLGGIEVTLAEDN